MKKFIKENKLIIIVFFIVVVLLSGVIGYTYSFFQVTVNNNTVIAGETESLKLSLEVTKILPDPNDRDNLIPQLDSAITSAIVGAPQTESGLTQGCRDANNNVICNVYKITLHNDSASSVYVNGTLELTAPNISNLRWAVVSGVTNPTLVSDIKNKNDTVLTSNEFYTGLQSKDYYIVIWISETGSVQTDRGSYNGVVTFTNTNGTSNVGGGAALTTLTSLGLDDEISNTVLTTFTAPSYNEKNEYNTLKSTWENNCVDMGYQNVDDCIMGELGFGSFDEYYSLFKFTLEDDTGIYATVDDFGTSYYFRGNVTNNYVKFGKNASNQDMWWRIVRINGDGTVRLIYDGISAHANGEDAEDRQVGFSEFNSTGQSNAYIGYMFGTPGGNTYEIEHANENDSTIKEYLDNWYEEVFLNTTYEQYIVDAIYCNDRKLVTNELQYKTWWGDDFNVDINGLGKSRTNSLYGLASRMGSNSTYGFFDSITPTLKCEQLNDRFTKYDLLNGLQTNGKLTYSIGLITADELVFGGVFYWLIDDFYNEKVYLYNQNWYWTMSSFAFQNHSSHNIMGGTGWFESDNVVANYVGVRPVVTLSSTALQYGSGAPGDPFRLTQ